MYKASTQILHVFCRLLIIFKIDSKNISGPIRVSLDPDQARWYFLQFSCNILDHLENLLFNLESSLEKSEFF